MWQPIYEDLANCCCLQGVGYTSAFQQHILEVQQRRLQQQQERQTSYKGKTLAQVLVFFEKEIRRPIRIMDEAMDEEWEDYRKYGSNSDGGTLHPFEHTFDNWGEEEWAAKEKVMRLKIRMKAIKKALELRN